MADEAVIIELQRGANPVNFTCASGTGIEKGALLTLSNPRTVAAGTEDSVFGGIAAAEKTSTDMATTIACWVPGQGNIFDLKACAGGVTLGAMVKLSGSNLICDASDADFEAGKVIGKSLEEGSADEVVAVLV